MLTICFRCYVKLYKLLDLCKYIKTDPTMNCIFLVRSVNISEYSCLNICVYINALHCFFVLECHEIPDSILISTSALMHRAASA